MLVLSLGLARVLAAFCRRLLVVGASAFLLLAPGAMAFLRPPLVSLFVWSSCSATDSDVLLVPGAAVWSFAWGFFYCACSPLPGGDGPYAVSLHR